MATRITNQATLTYQYAGTTGQAASNIATALLQEALSVAKTTLDAGYRRNGELTYILTATNSGANALTNVVLSDNLGAYTPAGLPRRRCHPYSWACLLSLSHDNEKQKRKPLPQTEKTPDIHRESGGVTCQPCLRR